METIAEALVKEYFNTVSTASIEPKVTQIRPEINRELYLETKECKGCKKPFGKHTIKKYFCHFCYEAFCSECCVLSINHPETAKPERSCNPCYLLYTKVNVLEVSEDFVQVQLQQQILERKKEEEHKERIKKEIEETHALMKEEEKEFRAEIEKIDKEIKEETEKRMDKEMKITQMKNKLEHGKTDSGPVTSTPTGKGGCMDCEIF